MVYLVRDAGEYQIDYYPDSDKEYFSECRELIDQGELFIKNPIFVCLQGEYLQKEVGFVMNTGLTGPLRIQNTEENQKKINEAIQANGLEGNQIRFGSIYKDDFLPYMKELRTSSYILFASISLILLVSIVSSYYCIKIFLLSESKLRMTKKLLGYSLWERYRSEIMVSTVIYLFGFLRVVLMGDSIPLLLLYMVFVIVDALITLVVISRAESKNIQDVLRGAAL